MIDNALYLFDMPPSGVDHVCKVFEKSLAIVDQLTEWPERNYEDLFAVKCNPLGVKPSIFKPLSQKASYVIMDDGYLIYRFDNTNLHNDSFMYHGITYHAYLVYKIVVVDMASVEYSERPRELWHLLHEKEFRQSIKDRMYVGTEEV